MKKFLTLIVICVFMIGACSTNGGDENDFDQITFAPNTDAQSLDPHFLNDSTSMQVSKMVYSALLKFDDNNELVGDLAEDWKVSEDGLVWTFNLKKGVTFHDGAELNADAVKKNFERVLDKDNALVQRAYFEMIEDIEVKDNFTIVFKTNKPFAPFEAHMSVTAAGIISPNAIDDYGKNLGKSAESSIGTGPYKLMEWSIDEQMVLERFDDYHGGKPITKTVIYKPIPEDSTRILALETGEVDIIQNIPASELSRLEGNKDIEITSKTGNGNRMFRFDTSKEPFKNPLVRQAISYAVDREAITDNLFPGLGKVSTSAITSAVLGYTDLGTIPYDPEKAKKLLAEAGYPDGFETKITTTQRYARGIELAEVIANQLEKVGITAKIDVQEWSVISQAWSGLTPEEFDQEIFIMGGAPPTLDADRGLRANYQTAETNELNYGFYSNEEYDELVSKAMTETDPEKRMKLYERAQEIIVLEDPAAIWIYDLYVMTAQRKNVKGVTISPLTMITFEKAYKEE